MQQMLFAEEPETFQEKLDAAFKRLLNPSNFAPEYEHKVKTLKTPGGLRILQVTARARPTSDSGSTGWPTPRAIDATSNVETPEARLARAGRAGGLNLSTAATLAGWGTPTAQAYGDTPETHLARKAKAVAAGASMGMVVSTLHAQAHLASAEPATGPTSTSSPAGTENKGGSRGSLNPAFSGWLMGYPAIWLACGLKAFAATRSRRGKSKAASDSSGDSATR